MALDVVGLWKLGVSAWWGHCFDSICCGGIVIEYIWGEARLFTSGFIDRVMSMNRFN